MNWNQIIVDWLIDGFSDEHGVNLRADGMAVQRLSKVAEKALAALVETSTTEINLPFIAATSTGPVHLLVQFSRDDFERLLTNHRMVRMEYRIDGLIEALRVCMEINKRS